MAGIMNDRKKILKLVKDAVDNPDHFLSLNRCFNKRCKTENRFSLEEFLQSLSSKDLSSLWESLYTLCSVTIDNLALNEGEDGQLVVGDTTSGNLISTLEGIVLWIHTYIKYENKPVITDELLQTIQLLHDVMLSVTEWSSKLTNSISLLCESWWLNELKDKESVITNMILYVLARTFYETAKVADIKRLWKVRVTFLLLDFEDDSANSIKELLLKTTFNPLFLTSDEGAKFITYIFGLHTSFISSIHNIIKSKLLNAPKWVIEVYSGVYYRAWRSSSGVYRDLIETRCIQDLMYMCTHAMREGGTLSQFNILRLVLDQFHQNMTQKSVQKMLYNLYRPFLWRSLKVANPNVRANATTLMLDVFPLYDPDFTRECVNDEMQKQFDLMKELLKDPAVIVRTVSILGVCQVLSYYWEMIPPHVIKSLLSLLFSELAFDVLSSAVRATVLHGVSILLEQRLSHVYLKDLLPLLGGHLHDSAEKVRLALLDLLILLKGMKSIKYWSICSIDSLLVRMEDDSHVVVKRIVNLLIDSFSTGTISNRLERCVVLVQSNPLSARKFYHHALSYMTVNDIEKFILAILNGVIEAVTNKDNHIIQEDSEMNKEEEKETCLYNTEIMNTLLEVSVILWEGLLAKKDSDKSNKALKIKVGVLFPKLTEHFQDSSGFEALYMLGSFLPYKSVGLLTSGIYDILSSTQSLSNSQGLLLALIKWGQEETVIELVQQGLVNGLCEDQIRGGKENRNISGAGNNNINKKRGGRSKEVTPAAVIPSPMVTIEILNYLMIHPLLYSRVKKVASFWNLMSTLHTVFDSMQHQISTATEPLERQDFIVKCVSCFITMGAHKMIESEETQVFEDQLKKVMFWCDTTLFELLSSSGKRKSTSRKRKSDQSEQCEINHTQLLHSVIKELLTVLSDLFLSGVLSDSMEDIVTDFAVNIISKVGLDPIYVSLAKLLYQLIDVTSCSRVDGIVSSLILPAQLLENILIELRHVHNVQYNTFSKMWSSFKPVINRGLTMSGYHNVLMITPSPLPVFTSLTKVVLTAHVEQMEKNGSLVVPSDITELPHYVSLLVDIGCKNTTASQRIFVTHIGHDVQESTNNLERIFSALHIISSLANIFELKDELLSVLQTCDECVLSRHETEGNPELVKDIQKLSKSLLQTLTT